MSPNDLLCVAPAPPTFELPEPVTSPGKTAVQQSRDNARLVEVIELLRETPPALQTKPAYAALLEELHALCATKDFYDTLMATYGF